MSAVHVNFYENNANEPHLPLLFFSCLQTKIKPQFNRPFTRLIFETNETQRTYNHKNLN